MPNPGDKRRNADKQRTEVYASCRICEHSRWVQYRIGVTSRQMCKGCARQTLNKIVLNPEKREGFQ